MANIASPAPAAVELPTVRKIGLSDLREALARGIDDFGAFPSHAIFLCVLYPIAGILLGGLALRTNVLPLVFPLVTGFALIGPFAAVGLYELSRRRELGLDSSWQHAFDVFRSPAKWSIFGLGVLLMLLFVAWLGVAQSLTVQILGDAPPASIGAFVHTLFFTQAGWRLIVWGNLLGLVFAIVVLSVGVVSFPLLIDRNVGIPVAMLTSIRAVLANPVVLALWGCVVAIALAVASLPFLVGLAVVMPVLGHASWHLYRRIVQL
ncbi:MAG TPA: DUF2189 domain-containing protein [Rhizomicrobium sp.]